jgi:hypothetical protein
MLEIVIAIAAIPVVAIAGWAIVESERARARGRQRADPALERRLENLSSAIVELRAELDDVASKQDTDRQLLEERLDFAERLLTRARGESDSR